MTPQKRTILVELEITGAADTNCAQCRRFDPDWAMNTEDRCPWMDGLTFDSPASCERHPECIVAEMRALSCGGTT